MQELKRSSDYILYAKDISLLSLVINSIWNYLIFFGQFLLIMQSSKVIICFIIPTIIIFVYANVLQMQLFIQIWRARYAESISSQDPYYIRTRSFINPNYLFYLLFGFSALFMIELMSFYGLLFCFLGSLWIPQIITNITNSSRKVLSIPYILSTTLNHLLAPVILLYKYS